MITLHELLNPANRREGETLDGVHIQLYERRPEVGGVWYFEPDNDIAKGWHYGSEGKHNAGPAGADEVSEEPQNNLFAGDAESLDWTAILNSSEVANKLPFTNGASNGIINGVINGSSKEVPNGTATGDSEDDFCYLTSPQQAPRWPSPAYEGLVGNVLPELIEFGAKPIPPPAGGHFPSMTETHDWLLSVANPLRSRVKTNVEVKSVVPTWPNGPDSSPTWIIKSRDWSSVNPGIEKTEEYDAVIICCGAFEHPFYPPTPGLDELLKCGSQAIMHAKSYPGPRPFVNQRNKLVVVGNANSANDVAAHLAPLNSDGPLYRCIRHESTFAHLPDPRIRDVPPIARLDLADDETVDVTLEDGRRLQGITKVIFASGYQYQFDWIRVPSVHADAAGVKSSPSTDLAPASIYGAVPDLHMGTFVAAAPTLSFIGLAACSTPMPLSEIQGRVVARTLFGTMPFSSGPLSEVLADFTARAKDLELRRDDPKGWRALHMIRGPEERKLVKALLTRLEECETGSSGGLFRWDDRRESIAKNLRAVKEGELRRLRNSNVSAGGVEGGVGGILSTGGTIGGGGIKPAPIRDPSFQRGKGAGL